MSFHFISFHFVTMYLHTTKRQRREQPQCWTDCESLLTTTTPSSHHLLQITAVSTSREELFWERFEKELVQKYWVKPCKKSNLTKSNDMFRQRIKIGYNVCARVLTKPTPSQKPLLVVLPSTPQKVSLPWNYIPAVCQERNIPLFLGSRDNNKIAQLLHLKQVSVMVFVSRSEREINKNAERSAATRSAEDETEENRFHKDVDSFIRFFSNKVPELRLVPRETSAIK